MFVAQCDQRQLRISSRRADLPRRSVLPRLGHTDLILELKHDALRRFFTYAFQLRKPYHVSRDHTFFKLIHVHAAQHCDRHGWSNSAHSVNQQQKHVALLFAGEAKQLLTELAEVQMSPQIHFETNRDMQPIKRRKRDKHLVPHPMHIHHQPIRIGLHHFSAQSCNHLDELAQVSRPVNVDVMVNAII